jgi:hypothetical protein
MRFAIVIIVAAACGGSKPETTTTERAAPPPPPAPPDAAAPAHPASVTDDMVAATDRVLAVLTKLADDVDHAGDCKSATAAIKADLAAVRAIAADADKVETMWSGATPEAQDWFKAHYTPQFTANNQKVGRMAKLCENDPDFVAAVQSLSAN